MGRVNENKLLKRNSLMETALHLFTSKGFTKTSVSDITERAGVAKGTFYLYFKDKYDLREMLIIHASERLFRHALEHSGYRELADAQDKVLAIVDDVLRELQKNTALLEFINKNLSWGIFRRAIIDSENNYKEIFEDILGPELASRKDLEIEVYTILELVGSTCHSVILENDPMDLESFLPYLHRSIRAIIASFRA